MAGKREREYVGAERCRDLVLIALTRGPMWTTELHAALRPEGMRLVDVYPALRVLENRGLVERVPQDGDRPARAEVQWRRVVEDVLDLDALQDQLRDNPNPEPYAIWLLSQATDDTAREDDR